MKSLLLLQPTEAEELYLAIFDFENPNLFTKCVETLCHEEYPPGLQCCSLLCRLAALGITQKPNSISSRPKHDILMMYGGSKLGPDPYSIPYLLSMIPFHPRLPVSDECGELLSSISPYPHRYSQQLDARI